MPGHLPSSIYIYMYIYNTEKKTEALFKGFRVEGFPKLGGLGLPTIRIRIPWGTIILDNYHVAIILGTAPTH